MHACATWLARLSADAGVITGDCPTAFRLRSPYRDAMNDYDQYIDTQRERLLKYLDPAVSMDQLDPHPLDFVNQVMDEWFERFSEQTLPMATLPERAFWFTLYELEEVEELRMLSADDPMLEFMEATLEQMRPILAAKRDIPDGSWATRPDGDDMFAPDPDLDLPDD